MRTLSAQQTATYANIYGAQSDRFTVEIDTTGAGVWLDLTSLYGFNFVQSISYGGSLDSSYDTASIKLHLQVADAPNYNLSPYATTSFINATATLISLYKKIRIRAATTSAGSSIADADLAVVFMGRIASFDITHTDLTLTCMDESWVLEIRYIEKVNAYSTASTTAVQTVMQSLLTDHFNTKLLRTGGSAPVAADQFTLYDGAGLTTFVGALSPAWNLRAYNQQRQPILHALRVLTDQIGWSLRWQYMEAALNKFVLVLEAPDRTAAASVLTIPYQKIIQYGPVRQSMEGLRNVCAIGYQNTSGERTLNQAGTAFVNGENTTSIDAVTRLWLEIQEDSASQIDTLGEAKDMSDRILYDLQNGLDSFQITIPYLLPVQLRDVITIPADNVISDTNRVHAVIGVQHDADYQGAKTTLTLRGTYESSGKFVWTERQASQPTVRVSGEQFITETSASPSGANMVMNGDFGDVGRF